MTITNTRLCKVITLIIPWILITQVGVVSATNSKENQFEGSYITECIEGIATSKITFTDDTYILEDTYYKPDTHCTEPDGVVIMTYTVEFPGGTTTTEHGEAVNINYTLLSATSDGVDIFDSSSTDYSIILLDGEKLYVANGIGSNPEQRPDTLKGIFWTKQH